MKIRTLTALCLLLNTATYAITFEQECLIKHVKKSIEQAKTETSQVTREILAIEGMSSPKNRHLLNNICSLPHANYLEVGVWKGSTFISALYKNKLHSAIAIDNWSEFNGPKDVFSQNVKTFLDPKNITILETDAFSLDKQKTFKQPINIYFYDGDHSFEAHKAAFTYFNDFFADTFIAIIDDYCYDAPQENAIQRGTKAAIQELGYNILYEEILTARHNQDTGTWWNGLFVAVIAKNGESKK